MKKKIIAFFCFQTLLASCYGPDIRFVKPQPENLNILTSIPEKFQGVFLLGKDTIEVTQYTINKDTIDSENLIVKGWGNYLFVNVLEEGLYKFSCGKSISSFNNEELRIQYFSIAEWDFEESFSVEEILLANKKYSISDVDTINGYFILDNVSVNQFQDLLNTAESKDVIRIK